jgi:hypothetical protein
MDLKQLNAFIAVANLRSFSAAAEKTGLSQPSLSRLLKQSCLFCGCTKAAQIRDSNKCIKLF